MRKHWAVVLAAIGVGAGAIFAEGEKKLPFEISKETTVVVEPLREDGMPDYLGALNEKYRVAPEENGFVAWLKVVGTGEMVFSGKSREEMLGLLGVQGRGADGEVWVSYPHYLQAVNGANSDTEKEVDNAEKMEKHVWKATDDPTLAAYLEKEAGLLMLAEEASKKAKWWVPTYSKSGIVIAAGIPTLAHQRLVAGSLCARGTLRAGAGDAARFMEDIGTVKRLARHVGGGRTLIERLVGLSMESLANKAVAGAANSGVFSAEQCGEIRKMCDGFGEMPGMGGAVHEFERWSVLDFAERLGTGQQGLFSSAVMIQTMMPFRTIEWSRVDWDFVLVRINGVYDELEEAMERPKWEDANKAIHAFGLKIDSWDRDLHEKHVGMLWQVAGETREAYSERVAEAILSFMSPSLGRAEELRRRGVMERAMVDVVLDAAMEKGRTGKWPVEMKGLPVDICSKDGKQLVKYVVRENGVEVYSVGDNGKDDGGGRGGETHADDLGVGVVPEEGK